MILGSISGKTTLEHPAIFIRLARIKLSTTGAEIYKPVPSYEEQTKCCFWPLPPMRSISTPNINNGYRASCVNVHLGVNILHSES